LAKYSHKTPTTTSHTSACPTTLTWLHPINCNGCTITEYGHRATALVNCGGCSTLVTSTTYSPFDGICPVSSPCRVGVDISSLLFSGLHGWIPVAYDACYELDFDCDEL
jgi:hypothetical protein